MKQIRERRHYIRKMGDGLVVLIDGKVFPLIDISVTGVSFQATGYSVGQSLSIKLAKLTSMADGVDGEITVVAITDTISRAKFYPTMRLMRFIIRQLSEFSGIAPRYFT